MRRREVEDELQRPTQRSKGRDATLQQTPRGWQGTTARFGGRSLDVSALGVGGQQEPRNAASRTAAMALVLSGPSGHWTGLHLILLLHALDEQVEQVEQQETCTW